MLCNVLHQYTQFPTLGRNLVLIVPFLVGRSVIPQAYWFPIQVAVWVKCPFVHLKLVGKDELVSFSVEPGAGLDKVRCRDGDEFGHFESRYEFVKDGGRSICKLDTTHNTGA